MPADGAPSPSQRLYDDALAYARSRRAILPDAFYALPIEARQWAFTVTGLASLDQVQGVLDGMNRSIDSGQTFADWKRAALIDPELGRLPPARLETVFRTNLQQAYNQGRDAQFERGKRVRPYLMWDAIDDTRTRPEHADMDGWIAEVDDPEWRRWHNRTKFNCRCKRIALTEQQARDRGLDTQGAPPNIPHDSGPPQIGWRAGMERAVAGRMARCSIRQAARDLSAAGWCLPGPMRDAIEQVIAAIAADPEALLAQALRDGHRGERYDLAAQRLRARGALTGPLTEAEAVALYLWSGDNSKKPEPDGTFPYQVIGRVLRAMGRGESSAEWPGVAAIVAGSMQALARLPEPIASEVFRGFGMRPGDFERAHLRKRAVFQYNSLTSFSSSLDVAREFAERQEDGWVMVLRNPRQLRDIGIYSALPSGAEFLAPVQRQYRVIEVDTDDRYIEAVEISADDREPLPRARNFSEADAEHEAWKQDFKRRLQESRRNPRPLTEAEELIGNHMIYG